MPADDRDPAAPPSLEPPSLFRRRRKPKPAEPDTTAAPEAPTEVLEPVVEPAPEPVAEPVAEPEPVAVEPAPVVPPKEPKAPRPPRAPRAPRTPRTPTAPVLTGLAAAVVTGLLVGVLVVLLTAGGQQACEAAQGTSSCGGAGYPLVLAILIVAIVAGGALLRWSQVPDPTSTSFLAVGLLAVIALLFLVEQLDSWWMLLVIPAVSTATYAASHWVTTAVIEPARE